MKARLRTVFAALATLTGAALLWRLLIARRGVRILAYHGIETQPSSPFSVSVADFERQLACLAMHYNIVDLLTVLKWQRGEYTSDKPMVVLTFDDGFRNNLELAAPILRRHGVPATFFVITGKLDGNDQRFMTAADARSLAANELFGIGSHTVNHQSVAQINDEDRMEEIGHSKSQLEFELGYSVECFCYPYGTFNDFDDSSVAALRLSGYSLATTSVNGINLRGTDPFRLRRTKVEWSDDIRTFRRIVNGALDGWFFVDYFLRFLQRPRAVKFCNANEAGTERQGNSCS